MCGSTCSMPMPGRRRRALIDLCGALLLLLPFMLVLLWFALPYVARSWAILETSRETSGLPAVFLLKTLIPLFALLMALQGVAQAIRAAHAAITSPGLDEAPDRARCGARRNSSPF